MPVEQAEVAERLIKRRVPWVVVFESRGEVWRGLEDVLAVPGNRHRVGAYIHSDWLKWALSGQADRGPFASSNSENDMLARRLSDASAALGARGDVGALEEVALERAIAANRCELARADDDVRDLEAAVAASRNSHERRSLRDALRHKTKERSRLRTSFF